MEGKIKITSSLHVFLSVGLDCACQMTSDEKKHRYRSALLRTVIHGIWDVDDGAMGEFRKCRFGTQHVPKVTSKRSQQLVRYEGLQADKQTHQKTWCNIQLLSEFERVLTERRTQLLLPWAPRFLCLRWISVKLRMTPLIGFVFSWTGGTTARSMTHRRGMTKLFPLLFRCDGE